MAVVLPVRKLQSRGVALLPWLVGATALFWALAGTPASRLAGIAVLLVAALLRLAAVHGYLAPSPDIARITTYGCWEAPLAFFVRHRGRGFLFHRTFDPATGDLPEQYCVIAVPSDCEEVSLRYTGFEPPEDSRLVGVVPVADLRFVHRGGSFVDAGSLSAVLERARSSQPGSAARESGA